jgi:hypothetical protein
MWLFFQLHNMNWLKKIKRWPIEKKRIFAFSGAIFFTILIIIFNSGINVLWKDKTTNKYIDNTPFNSIKESLSEIANETKPILEKAFNSTTSRIIIEQNTQSTSSSSTTPNVVK